MAETLRGISGRDTEVGLGLQGKINQRRTCSTLQPSNLFLDMHAKGWSWMKLNVNDKKMGGFFFPSEKMRQGSTKSKPRQFDKILLSEFQKQSKDF